MYAFSVDANSLARGFPKNIRDVFPPLESGDHPDGNIDAAYFSYTHNAVFLLKDTRFWQVVGSRDRWRRPYLPRNGLLPHKEVDERWFDICDVHPTALKLTRWGRRSRFRHGYSHWARFERNPISAFLVLMLLFVLKTKTTLLANLIILKATLFRDGAFYTFILKYTVMLVLWGSRYIYYRVISIYALFFVEWCLCLD